MDNQIFAVSGSSGLVGSAFCKFLENKGHKVIRLVRDKKLSASNNIFWNPQEQVIEQDKLKLVDCVVHLAGENIAAGLWTKRRKALIFESRVQGTKLITEALKVFTDKKRTLISASAIGFYGDRAEEICDESSCAGSGFLPEVARAWENAALTAASDNLRVVVPRIGIVISKRGGALAKMRLPFSLGLGGCLGNGQQYVSWISLNDLLRLIYFLANNQNVNGIVNAVAPHPVTNTELTHFLAQHLNRPAFLHVPACLLKIALGEFAKAALLSSTRVVSTKLSSWGFHFEQTEIQAAIELD